jgi:hypothetical protein
MDSLKGLTALGLTWFANVCSYVLTVNISRYNQVLMPGRTYPLKMSFTLAKIRFVVDLQTVVLFFVINMVQKPNEVEMLGNTEFL